MRELVVVAIVTVGCGAPARPSDPRPVVATPETTPPAEPAGDDRIERPKAEVASAPTVDLPAVPAFDLPPADAGFRTVKELRVRGRALVDTKVKVKGYITWIYDCPTAIAKPGLSRKQILKQIERDPTVCERPKLYLGDAPDTPPDVSLWVVDVPRKPTKLEKERLPKTELASWPKVPTFKLGDRVTIAGTFAVKSPFSEVNSDGLLIYEALEPARSGTPGTAPAAPPPSTVRATRPQRVMPTAVDRAARDTSIAETNECVKAFAQEQYATAVATCERAVAAWDGNHQALYTLGAANAGDGRWSAAIAAFARAAALAPDEPMYQLWHGVALVEHGERDAALAVLLSAIELEPRLWRAHYYAGKVHRDAERWRDAAESFTAAIRANPREANPYIALAELYRRWDHVDLTIAVATSGTANIPGTREAAAAWFVLGVALDSKRLDDQAIEALTRALDGRPDLARARFQRGLVHHRKGDLAAARRDLEDFVKSRDAIAFEGQHANRVLLDIASKSK